MSGYPDDPTRPTTPPHARPGWSDSADMVSQEKSAMAAIKAFHAREQAAAGHDAAANAAARAAGQEQGAAADPQLQEQAPQEAAADALDAYLAASQESRARHDYTALKQEHAEALQARQPQEQEQGQKQSSRDILDQADAPSRSEATNDAEQKLTSRDILEGKNVTQQQDAEYEMAAEELTKPREIEYER